MPQKKKTKRSIMNVCAFLKIFLKDKKLKRNR